ncbi:MAG: AMP-binding protein [Cytophagales bacterium]|nr:AMP-binding protein [Cytophagales bacterium]
MSSIWKKSYPKGIPHEIAKLEYPTVGEMFRSSCRKYADRTAYLNAGHRLSYRDLELRALGFAHFLTESLKLKKGDAFAIQMPNLLQYPIVFFGAVLAGLRIVNMNPLYTAREMKHQLVDADVRAIVILENFADKLEEILPDTHIDPHRVVLTRVGDMMGGFLKRTLVNCVVKRVKKMVPNYSLPSHVPFRKALAEGNPHDYVLPTMVQDSDVVLLQYTGGTTGSAKGAALSHRNLLSNIAQIAAWIDCLEEANETVVTALPMYHIFALSCNVLYPLTIGASNVLITNPRDMKSFISDLQRYPFSFITGVNTLFNGLLNQPAFADIDFSKIKLAVGGGMTLQKSVVESWGKWVKTPLIEGYGLSETSPVLTINPADGTHKVGSIGLPVPSTEIRILGSDDKELPLGEIGELCARGPQVMSGYWNRPEETKRSFVEGFLKTGDLARMDEDGFLYLVERKKEMIIVSGFNVYPNEVEGVLTSHPQVLEAGVVGVPADKTGEQVIAFVVKREDSLTEEELRSHAKKDLAAYKCPAQYRFVEDLPKSPVGKILRRVLRETWLAK